MRAMYVVQFNDTKSLGLDAVHSWNEATNELVVANSVHCDE